MTRFHKNVGISSRSLAQKTVCSLPSTVTGSIDRLFGYKPISHPEIVECDPFGEGDTFESLRILQSRETVDFRPLDALIVTAGLSSKILLYAVFCCAITSCPIPLEKWHFCLLMFGPWWSSAFWVEWVCYDFFRSAFAKDPFKEVSPNEMDFISKWCPYEYHPEIRWAYQHNKRSFYFCALILFSLYALICNVRPQTSRILLKKIGDSWGPKLQALMAKNTLQFINAHKDEIDTLLSIDDRKLFEKCYADLNEAHACNDSARIKDCLSRVFALLDPLPICSKFSMDKLYTEDCFNI